jgi:hypothetical protein
MNQEIWSVTGEVLERLFARLQASAPGGVHPISCPHCCIRVERSDDESVVPVRGKLLAQISSTGNGGNATEHTSVSDEPGPGRWH